jgi:hypothetical protein
MEIRILNTGKMVKNNDYLSDNAEEGPESGEGILDPEDGEHLLAELHLVAAVPRLVLKSSIYVVWNM